MFNTNKTEAARNTKTWGGKPTCMDSSGILSLFLCDGSHNLYKLDKIFWDPRHDFFATCHIIRTCIY